MAPTLTGREGNQYTDLYLRQQKMLNERTYGTKTKLVQYTSLFAKKTFVSETQEISSSLLKMMMLKMMNPMGNMPVSQICTFEEPRSFEHFKERGQKS